MSVNTNKNRGSNWERDVVNYLKGRGWDAATSRYVSRLLDDQGVDIAGDYPMKIQCKATVKQPNVHELLETTAADVVFFRKMQKKGNRFFNVGEYALLDLDTFMDLIDSVYKKGKK